MSPCPLPGKSSVAMREVKLRMYEGCFRRNTFKSAYPSTTAIDSQISKLGYMLVIVSYMVSVAQNT
jgi:hypothetical protein